MPIYEYVCSHCNHQFDRLQKISDAPIKTCPQCDKDTVVRLVSAAGFQLKGSGWYVTDFKNKGKSESKTETKTEQSVSSETSKETTKASSEAKKVDS